MSKAMDGKGSVSTRQLHTFIVKYGFRTRKNKGKRLIQFENRRKVTKLQNLHNIHDLSIWIFVSGEV